MSRNTKSCPGRGPRPERLRIGWIGPAPLQMSGWSLGGMLSWWCDELRGQGEGWSFLASSLVSRAVASTPSFQKCLRVCIYTCLTWSEDCFYNCSWRNNVAVLFGTLKVQSFMLTEVRDCDMLIVVTSSTFLKRKDILKEKISWPRSSKPAAQHIYRQMYCVHLYGLYVYCALVNVDSSGSPGVRPTPGLTSSIQVVCACVRAYTSTHTPTTLTPTKIEKYTRQNPYLFPCQNIASRASNKR